MYKDEKMLGYAYENRIKIPAKQSVKEGSKVVQEDIEVTLVKKDLGEIYLATGQIVANDPLVLFENKPYTVSVSAGHYPVSISVAHFSDNGY